MATGYNQIELDEASRTISAFTSHLGLFQYKVMPFGLCNAPATFVKLMNKVLRGLIGKICMVYLDDIIIKGVSFRKMMKNLKTVMQRLWAAGLKLKAKKCNIFQTSVKFLGHIVSADGIATNPEKIEEMVSWPIQWNTREVSTVLGLFGYYRRFCSNYAERSAPLNALKKIEAKFVWHQEHQDAFDSLKEYMLSCSYSGFSFEGRRVHLGY